MSTAILAERRGTDSMKELMKSILGGIIGRRSYKGPSAPELLQRFRELLNLNRRVLDRMADADEKLGGEFIFDSRFIEQFSEKISADMARFVFVFGELCPEARPGMMEALKRLEAQTCRILQGDYCGDDELFIAFGQVSRDHQDCVGGKGAYLAEASQALDVAIPRGFLVTVQASRLLLAAPGPEPDTMRLLDQWYQGRVDTEEASHRLRRHLQNAEMPKRLRQGILRAYDRLRAETGREDVILRSSSPWEGGEYSFAGVFESHRASGGQEVIEAFRAVVASLFSPRAMEYSRSLGFRPSEMVMAVVCQEYLQAEVSGIVTTLDASRPAAAEMVLEVVEGGLEELTAGRASGKKVRLPRPEVEGQGAERCTFQEPWSCSSQYPLACDPQGQDTASGPVRQVLLAGIPQLALSLERYFKRPQEIEFAVTRDGRPVLLQCRPLVVSTKDHSGMVAEEADGRLLLDGDGSTVQEGVGIGPLVEISETVGLASVPDGAVVVAPDASMRLAGLVPRISGLVTCRGSSLGHLASLCREYGLPSVFGVRALAEPLPLGRIVTLDAGDRRLYLGGRQSLYLREAASSPADTKEFRLLRSLLRRMEPVTVLDPADDRFRPSGCRTYHDILLVGHQRAVERLAHLRFERAGAEGLHLGRMQWKIPLDLAVIDLGDGIVDGPDPDGTVRPEQISSRPMAALMRGLSMPGAWSFEPVGVDVSSFMSSLTRTFALEFMEPSAVGQNIALLDRNFVHLNLRLGYHFNMVDAYLSGQERDNYIYFRFFGGVTDRQRRQRRARLIEEVLEAEGFVVHTHKDLVSARTRMLEPAQIEQMLFLLGILIGFTRQLDVSMTDDRRIEEFKQAIFAIKEGRHE